jgi:hypothetical protein
VSEHRRRIDTVLEPEYLSDIADVGLDELRERRESAEDVETQISYYRRLLHGRMDLIISRPCPPSRPPQAAV